MGGTLLSGCQIPLRQYCAGLPVCGTSKWATTPDTLLGPEGSGHIEHLLRLWWSEVLEVSLLQVSPSSLSRARGDGAAGALAGPCTPRPTRTSVGEPPVP